MSNDTTGETTDTRNERTLRRRHFLGSLGVLGATAGMGVAGAESGGKRRLADHVAEWPSLDDSYYASLVDDLDGIGLPPGAFVYAENEADTMAAYDVSGSAATTSSIDLGDDVPFNEARRVEITGDVSNPWDVTMIGTVEDRAVSQGDVLLGVAYLRSPTAGDDSNPEVRYVAKDEDNTGTNMVRNPAQPTLGTEWNRYYFQVQFNYSSEAGTWWTEMFMGFGQQTVDIGGLALIDFDTDVTLDDLPTWQPSYEYQGRAQDAQWRQQANARIQNYRTADLEVTVVDTGGNPVEGARVNVSMAYHEFDFGTAVAVNQLPDGNDTYRGKLFQNFNKAVPENGLKAPAWRGSYGESLGPESTRAAIDYLTGMGMPTRGHALVWEEFEWMGIDSSLPASEINTAVKESIRNRASEFAGQLPEWDMHNHPIWQSNIRDQIGRDYVPEWWATAHDAAPDAEMYVNEMNIVDGGSYSDAYDQFTRWLTDNGVKVDGIGFMGHFGINSLTPPAEIISTFDRFAQHGVPLLITEFDVELDSRDDEEQVQAQADYVRDVLTAAFSHEAVEGVMSWGFWESEHWRPTAAYWDAEWNIRPHGEEYRRLVFDEWWTNTEGETGSDGTYTVTGFKGDYDLIATGGIRDMGRRGTASVTLSDGGASVEITIDESTETATDTGTDTTPTATETDTTPTATAETGDDGTPTDTETNETQTTETGGQPGLGVLSGLAGLAGLTGYALSRRDDEE